MSLLIDTVQLYYCVRKAFDGRRIDYPKYIEKVESIFGDQDIIIAYIAKPDDSANKFISYLDSLGVNVVVKEPRPIRVGKEEAAHTNFNVELSCDALRLAKPDKPMIIGSNDIHLLPLLRVLSRRVGCLCVYATGVPNAFKPYAQDKEIGQDVLREAPVKSDVTATTQ